MNGNIFCNGSIRIIVSKIGSSVLRNRNPHLSCIDGDILRLHIAAVAVDNDAVHPNGSAGSVPAIFAFAHGLAGPCFKSILAIRCRPCPQADVLPIIGNLRMNLEFFYILRQITGGLCIVTDFHIFCISHRDPSILAFQLVVAGLNRCIIRIDNNVVGGFGNPAVIPAIIVAVCFHLATGPCIKSVCAIVCPCPQVRV